MEELLKFLPLQKAIISIWPVTTADRGVSKTTIIVKPEYIKEVLMFLKSSANFRMMLSDIFCVDNMQRHNRFEINYNLLSTYYNERLNIKIFLKTSQSVESVTSVFKSADWLEREIWDLYGVYFFDHPDLRRILSDYGFEGFPMRKDFPLSGYVEVRYDDETKKVLIEPIFLTQEFRLFDFVSPWEQDTDNEDDDKSKK